MADSLLDLEGLPIFAPDIDWKNRPTTGFENSFQILSFKGTSNELIELDANKPEIFRFRAGLDKDQEFTLINEFVSFKGRLECFWFIDLAHRFILKENINSLDSNIIVFDNGFVSGGFERVFIKLKNGDRLTRKILTSQAVLEDLTLGLNSSVGQNIAVNDVKFVTLLHLCRFNSDKLSISHLNSEQAEVDIDLFHLVKEQKAL